MTGREEVFLSVMAVAERFDVSTRSVWRAVARGELPQPCHVGRSARWPESEIDEFIQRLKGRRLK